MAVSDRTCKFFALSHFILIAGSIAVIAFNSSYKAAGLGTNTSLVHAFRTGTNIMNSFMIVVVALELVARSSMSAFFVYPCDYQKRTMCCWEYKMPTFWLITLGLSVVSFIVAAAITAAIIIMVGLPNIQIVRVAVPTAIPLVQLILAWISFRKARVELKKEIDEELADQQVDETVVPLVDEPQVPQQMSPQDEVFMKSPRPPLPTPSPYSYSPRHASPSVRNSQGMRGSATLRSSSSLRTSGSARNSPAPSAPKHD